MVMSRRSVVIAEALSAEADKPWRHELRLILDRIVDLRITLVGADDRFDFGLVGAKSFELLGADRDAPFAAGVIADQLVEGVFAIVAPGVPGTAPDRVAIILMRDRM